MKLTELWDRLVGRFRTRQDAGPERGPRSYSSAVEDADLVRTHFERMVEIAADGIISMDEDHRIVLFNTGAEEIFGYDRDEVLGGSLDILLPERHRDAHARHVAHFASADTEARRMGERRQISGVRKDGTEFPAEASISRIQTSDGYLFTVVIRDITERKRSEETHRFLSDASAVLAQSLDYATTLAGLTRVALPRLADWCTIDVVDADGALQRIQAGHADAELDRVAQELLDYPPEPGGSHPAMTVVDTGEAELLDPVPDALIQRLARDADHARIFDRLGAKSLLALPLVARGRTLGALTLVIGGGDRRFEEGHRLASELARRAATAVDNARLYQEAKQAVAARDDVLTVVSHDLGNPLSAILVTTRVLERLIGEDTDPVVRQHLESLRGAANQMEGLIRDLLEIRRIEAGQLRLVARPTRAEALVEQALRSMGPLAREQGIMLESRIDVSADASVMADPDRVQRIFSNLVGNALKFTPEGGRVTISVEPADDGEGGAAFTVTDTGPGMAAEEVERVFDAFWQARHQGSRGVGLGLAISRGIVEAHGGTIEVFSAPGQGARFRFTLPSTGSDVDQPTTAASNAPT